MQFLLVLPTKCDNNQHVITNMLKITFDTDKSERF
jgi:hypothetical protein